MIKSKEVWVPVKGYEGHYEVSSRSRIRSIDRVVNNISYGDKNVKGVILKPANNPQGYPCVSLSLNADAKTSTVHRIVATAFIPNPKNKKCINHKNGIKTDCRISNLEWATHSENNFHAYSILGKVLKMPSGKDSPFSKKVYCSTLDVSFDSVREAHSALGIGNIDTVCRGKRNHSCGLYFRYLQ